MISCRHCLKLLADSKGISVTALKNEMHAAINAAYVNPNTLAHAVPCKGRIPSVEEFLEYAAQRTTPKVCPLPQNSVQMRYMG